jgi:hypothetical protein
MPIVNKIPLIIKNLTCNFTIILAIKLYVNLSLLAVPQATPPKNKLQKTYCCI